MVELLAFMLSRHRLVGVYGWAVPDLLPGQRNLDDLRTAEWLIDCAGQNQQLAPGKPLAGINDEVADRPRRVVKVRLLNDSDLAVAGVYS